jgi:4-aminobutyrate aminotransferase-like enzyme
VFGGRVPVFVVLGNEAGGLQANYHGTTLLAQTLRGMWPELLPRLERGEACKVVAVRPNRIEDARAALEQWDRPPYRVAGFLHELVMMNYGAVRLERAYVRDVYALCASRDVPVLCDEIQSCLWMDAGFQFREYGLAPDFVAVGKGFPGGEYAASRILFRSTHDALPQFGALVTNGQEELASLAYLITMRWAAANAEVTRAVGDRFETRLQELAAAFPGIVARVCGRRHMQAIHFHDVAPARQFAQHLVDQGLDISIQAYKTEVPPAALLKLPLVAGYEIVDFVIARMHAVLKAL